MEENPPPDPTPTANPTEINKDPEVIKAAQVEIGKVDVLVCGSCHEVFHFIEEFQTHKSAPACTATSTIKENYQHEPKPQVWAFMLWKSSQFKNVREGESVPTSWVVYQRWCKLTPEDKEAWIVAAKNIQSFTKLSTAKMQEVRLKSQTQLVEKKGSSNENMVTVESLVDGKRISESDPLEEGEIRLALLTEAQRNALKAQTELNKVSEDADPLGGVEDMSMEEEEGETKTRRGDVSKANDLIKKGIVKPVQLNSDVTILPSHKKSTKKAMRTIALDKKEEYVVEKIISKRFNPRKKTFEYLIKWENFDKSENTWEPISNLDTCKEMLQEFESNLQKQKLQKMNKPVVVHKEKKEVKEDTPALTYTIRGRPQRTSKQKALNQVKVWCGDISDTDDEPSSKRKHDDDSDSDSIEKRIKREVEENSESSDDELLNKVSVPMKKIVRMQKSSVNGIDKAPVPHNILIPDSQGIIRLNQKQASELSSGVYIMSKTAGIIKLDSNTSKMATSGGQTIVKVAPKIGQTHVKVVKKDAASNVIKLTPKADVSKPKPPNTKVAIPRLPVKVTAGTPKAAGAKPVLKKKSSVEAAKTTVAAEKVEAQPEEDSDGLSEMEFPTDLPIPSPDSPPGEFTLDPNTGKLMGIEYPPDKDVVISEIKPRVTLENLVKQTTEDEEEQQSALNKTEDGEVRQAADKLVEQLQKGTETVAVVDKPHTNGSSILQKKLLSTPSRPPPAPRVQKPHVLNPTTMRHKSVVRTRIMSPKQKNVLPTNTPTITRVRHSYANKSSVPRKIGQTTIYRTSVAAAAAATPPQKLAPKPRAVVKVPSPESISMPSLAAEPADVVEPLTVPETLSDLSSLAEMQEQQGESPLMLTGEDGTVYQVAGQNEEGQTILISQGADGQQQCLVVATESLHLEEGGAQGGQQVVQMSESDEELQETLEGEAESDSSTEETQVVAQLIGADPPSPGGKRNVTVMLPDGSCVTMSVTQEQYEALEIDK